MKTTRRWTRREADGYDMHAHGRAPFAELPDDRRRRQSDEDEQTTAPRAGPALPAT